MRFKATKQTKDSSPVLVFPSRKSLHDFLNEFGDGEELVVEIYSKRTLPQNRLFHKWIGEISDHIGETFDVTKVYVVCAIWGCEEHEIDGVWYKIPKSTSEMTKEEFSNGLSRLQAWALETFNIHLSN